MLKNYFLFSSLLFFLFGQGQTFVKNIGNPGIDDGVTCLQEYQNKLYVSGYSGKRTYVAEYDLNGLIIWKKYYSFSESRNFVSDFIIDNDRMILVGYGHDSGSDIFDEFFVSLNLNSKKVDWARKTGINIKPNNVHLHKGNLYVTGDEYAKGKFGLCFLELNPKNGKLEDFTTWYFTGHESAAVSYISEGVLFTGGRYGVKGRSDKYRASISQFSLADFDQIQSNYFLNSKKDFARAYLADFIVKEDEIIAACFSNNRGIDNNYSISMVNTAKNGSVNWSYEYKVKGYSSLTVRDMVELEDSYLILGFTKAPQEDLLLIYIDKEGYPIQSFAIGGEYSDKILMDQGHYIVDKGDDLYLAAQSKSINTIGDFDSFILKLDKNEGFQDSCIVSKELEIEMFAYDEFVEGEIFLMEYDTAFKETNIAFEYENPRTELDRYLCQQLPEEIDSILDEEISFKDVAFNNTVFLMDASLSMNRSDRMPILKNSLFKILNYMREEDKISVVSFSDEADLILSGTSASEGIEIKGKIDSLSSGGQSDILAGLDLGIKTANEHFNTSSNNRIIITTDGDLSFDTQKKMKERMEKSKNEDLVFTIFLFNNSSTYYNQLTDLVSEIGGKVQVVNPQNMESVLLEELKAKKQ